MGRSKRQLQEGQYTNLSYFLLKSPAWRSLSGAGMKLYFELHTRFNGTNNGRLFVSLGEAAKALGMGKATVQRAFEDLQEKGFVVRTKKGSWYHRQAHEWRLTTKPTLQRNGKKENATNDWKSYRPPKKQKRGSHTERNQIVLGPIENPETMNGSKLEPVSDLEACE